MSFFITPDLFGIAAKIKAFTRAVIRGKTHRSEAHA